MSQHDERRHGDQIHCHVCGKQWDYDDPEPPECISEEEKKRRQESRQKAKRRSRDS